MVDEQKERIDKTTASRLSWSSVFEREKISSIERVELHPISNGEMKINPGIDIYTNELRYRIFYVHIISQTIQSTLTRTTMDDHHSFIVDYHSLQHCYHPIDLSLRNVRRCPMHH